MKITFISDSHFGISKIALEDQLQVFDLIPKDTDVLFHLGDVFHNKFRLERQLFDTVYRKFRDLFSMDKYIILGNHDFYSYHKDPPMTSFEEISTVISKQYFPISIEDYKIHCVPYRDTLVEIEEGIAQACNNLGNKNILLTHIGVIEGVIGESNTHLQKEYSLDILHPEKFDLVLLGHYHKHQKITNNVYYIGSPMQLNFGEAGESKGLMVLDTKTKHLEFIKNHLSPQFHQLKVNSEKELAKIDLNKKDFYKIELTKNFDHVFLTKIAEGKNLIYEGGASYERNVRLGDINKSKDIVKDYINIVEKSTKNFNLDKTKLTEMGIGYL